MQDSEGCQDPWMEHWMNLYGDRLVRYAFVITRDPELAQDVAQESFLKLMLFHRRRPAEAVSPAWLFKVARNQAFDMLKQNPVPAQPTLSRFRDDGPIWLPILLRQMLSELSVLDRECLWLFYDADWPTKDIAHYLKVSPGTVRGRMLRARRRLQQLWEVDQDGHEFPKG